MFLLGVRSQVFGDLVSARLARLVATWYPFKGGPQRCTHVFLHYFLCMLYFTIKMFN